MFLRGVQDYFLCWLAIVDASTRGSVEKFPLSVFVSMEHGSAKLQLQQRVQHAFLVYPFAPGRAGRLPSSSGREGRDPARYISPCARGNSDMLSRLVFPWTNDSNIQ